jgi:hypothetical protein
MKLKKNEYSQQCDRLTVSALSLTGPLQRSYVSRDLGQVTLHRSLVKYMGFYYCRAFRPPF